jgi:hypothetical protein
MAIGNTDIQGTCQNGGVQFLCHINPLDPGKRIDQSGSLPDFIARREEFERRTTNGRMTKFTPVKSWARLSSRLAMDLGRSPISALGLDAIAGAALYRDYVGASRRGAVEATMALDV